MWRNLLLVAAVLGAAVGARAAEHEAFTDPAKAGAARAFAR